MTTYWGQSSSLPPLYLGDFNMSLLNHSCRNGSSVFPCPKCGSHNTELKDPNSLVDTFMKFLGAKQFMQARQGQKVLVCKDCGDKSLLMVL